MGICSRLLSIFKIAFEIIQSVCALLLLFIGIVLIWSGGFPATIESLSNTTSTTGFTLLGLGVAIASFVIAEKNQREFLETVKARN